MPGTNAGGNLNIFVFEVGILQKNPVSGLEVPVTVSVHPMVVVPQSIRYTDGSRTAVTQTVGGSLKTIGGRALRQVAFEGSFGVESRGVGPYIGTGEIRFQRFYREVVRLPEALTRAEIDSLANDLFINTPGIPLILRSWSDKLSTLFVNFYDFWNDRAFQAHVPSWADSRASKQGGASGLVHYSLQVQEVGPLVGGIGTAILQGILNGLTSWNAANELLNSLTIQAVLDSTLATLGPFQSELSDSMEAVRGQVDSVTGLMGGTTPSGMVTPQATQGLADFFASARRMATSAEQIAQGLSALSAGEPNNDTGAIDFSAAENTGFALELDRFDQRVELANLADTGRFQAAAGAFFGMDRQTYQAYVAGGGAAGLTGPDIGSTLTHEVGDTDTADTLESTYGISWGRILEINDLTPDEGLRPRQLLLIPLPRARGPLGIEGLPTLGSHVGSSAWGQDLAMEMEGDTDGNPILVDGVDCLEQGMTYLLEEQGAEILKGVQSVPGPGRERYLAKRFQVLLQSDPRMASTSGVTVEPNSTGGYDVAGSATAINGGSASARGIL